MGIDKFSRIKIYRGQLELRKKGKNSTLVIDIEDTSDVIAFDLPNLGHPSEFVWEITLYYFL